MSTLFLNLFLTQQLDVCITKCPVKLDATPTSLYFGENTEDRYQSPPSSNPQDIHSNLILKWKIPWIQNVNPSLRQVVYTRVVKTPRLGDDLVYYVVQGVWHAMWHYLEMILLLGLLNSTIRGTICCFIFFSRALLVFTVISLHRIVKLKNKHFHSLKEHPWILQKVSDFLQL